MMDSADFTFQTEDGTPLHVSGWAVDEPKAIVQVLHGIAEHGARYARLAEALGRVGYTTYAHDHRGHGKSLREGSPPGHVADDDGWNLLVEDAHAVNREIAGRHPSLPIIILGQSMGSFVLQQLLYVYPDDMVGAALFGSTGKPPATAVAAKLLGRIERLRVGRSRPSPLIQNLSFGRYNKAFAPTRTEYDWLSRDPDEVDAYMSDPLSGYDAPIQTWLEMLWAMDRNAKPDNVAKVPKDLPLYLVAGDQDPVGENGKGMRNLHDAYRRAGVRDVRLVLYPGGRHEMLNETNRDQVTADLIAWFDEVVAAQS